MFCFLFRSDGEMLVMSWWLYWTNMNILKCWIPKVDVQELFMLNGNPQRVYHYKQNRKNFLELKFFSAHFWGAKLISLRRKTERSKVWSLIGRGSSQTQLCLIPNQLSRKVQQESNSWQSNRCTRKVFQKETELPEKSVWS